MFMIGQVDYLGELGRVTKICRYEIYCPAIKPITVYDTLLGK